jgi:hypothetical protein
MQLHQITEVMSMKSNVVLADRTIRLGAGMLLLASPLLEIPSYPLNLLGLVLVGTALIGYCPIYGILSALGPHREVERPAKGPKHGSVAKA